MKRSRWVLQSLILRISVFQEQINMSHVWIMTPLLISSTSKEDKMSGDLFWSPRFVSTCVGWEREIQTCHVFSLVSTLCDVWFKWWTACNILLVLKSALFHLSCVCFFQRTVVFFSLLDDRHDEPLYAVKACLCPLIAAPWARSES